MNVLLRIELSFFIIVILLWTSIYANSDSQDLDQLIDAGREEVYHFRLEKALEIFRSIQHKYPNHPHGYFYESYVTAIYYSQDQTNPKIDSLLHLTVSKSVEIAEKYKKLNQLDRRNASNEQKILTFTTQLRPWIQRKMMVMYDLDSNDIYNVISLIKR